MIEKNRIDEVRVLYVGTDHETAESAAAGLEAECPELAVHSTVAAEALSSLDDRFDCVVCAADGDERPRRLIEEVRGAAPDAFLVLFADASDPDRVREAYAAGVDDYVPAVGADPLVALAHGIRSKGRVGRRRDGPPATRSHVEALARSASDAIVTIDAESRIRFVNPAIEEVLGYEPDDLLGEPLTVLMSDDLAARHRRGLRRYLEEGERRLDWDYVELPGVHAAGHEVPLGVSFSEFRFGGDRFFTGVLRDVTARKERETERELLSTTTELVAEAETLEDGLRAAFAEVGGTLGWSYGEAWLPTEAGDRLRLGASWHDPAVDADGFEAVSAEATFEPGTGLPGRVWESGSPEWIPDVAAESTSTVVRADAAREAGFGAALGVPVRSNGRTVAVFLFCLPSERAADDRLLRMTSTVAENLGRLVGRRRAETELRRERELKNRILEASPVGIVLFDSAGEIEFANAHAGRILGVEDDGESSRYGEYASRLYDRNGDPISEREQLYRRILETGEGATTELQFERNDGDRVWLTVNGVPLRDGDETTGVLVAFTDVTEQKRLESEFEETLGRITDAFYAVDDEFRFTHVNERAEQLLQRPEEELLGEVLWELYPEAAEVDEVWDAFHTALEDQETTGYEVYFPPLGFWVEANVYPSETGLSIYFRDITERKARERELEQYETMIDTVSDGIYALDADSRFLAVNDAYVEMTGYSREELLGTRAAAVVGAATEDEAVRLQNSLESHDDVETLETTITTADGDEFEAEVRISLFPGDDGFGRVGVVRDITERKRYEETLAALHWSSRELLGATSRSEVTEVVLDAAVDALDLPGAGIYLRDPDGDALVPSAVSEYVTGIFGEMSTLGPGDDSVVWRTYEAGEVIAHPDLSAVDRIHRDDTPLRSGIWIPLGGHGVLAVVSEEIDAFDDRDRQLAELLAANAEEALDRVDRETTLRRRGEQLTRLNEKSQELAAAEIADEVAEIAVSAAAEALGLPLAAIELYDEETSRLRPAARTPELTEMIGSGDPFVSEEDVPWQVFLRNERAVYDDADAEDRVMVDGTALGSAVVLPLGKYGVFVCGSTEPGAFTAADVSFAEILSGNVVSALDRVDRERSLRERTAMLEEQNENLERLGHINEVIRGIVQVLIRASTREEIEQTVCDRLVGAEPYRFAWIGARDPVTEEVEPRAWAGVERGYLDRVTVTADDSPTGQGPIGRAIRTHEVQVQNDINFDREFDAWREAALERGYRSSIAVPLVYEETLYGVLALYGNRSGLFNEMERSVLAELGEMVGYSLNALERKRALTGERSIELELGVAGPRRRWLECVDREGYEFELGTVSRRGDGTLRAFYVVRGESVEEARSIGREATAVEDVTLVSEREDGWLFTCTLRESSFLAKLLDRGAVPEKITSADGRARIVIRIPASAEIRTFVELFGGAYGTVDLLARRERAEPVRTLQDYRTELTDRLTDRQREILQTAYESGFFEWPRGMSAQELAAVFDVSQPTISRHLRRGEEKVFSMLFDDADDPDLDI